jgi:hypothetical protein
VDDATIFPTRPDDHGIGSPAGIARWRLVPRRVPTSTRPGMTFLSTPQVGAHRQVVAVTVFVAQRMALSTVDAALAPMGSTRSRAVRRR